MNEKTFKEQVNAEAAKIEQLRDPACRTLEARVLLADMQAALAPIICTVVNEGWKLGSTYARLHRIIRKVEIGF